ncbi:MAG: hypothetical protein JW934_11760 [Anaerolineae bacterium]|nr:hypothetical protein [Anaerolineae bacterium]
MENTSRLYGTFVKVLGAEPDWVGICYLEALVGMMVGPLASNAINLTEWAPVVQSRAQYAQSTVRRFRRWLGNKRMCVCQITPVNDPTVYDKSDPRLCG